MLMNAREKNCKENSKTKQKHVIFMYSFTYTRSRRRTTASVLWPIARRWPLRLQWHWAWHSTLGAPANWPVGCSARVDGCRRRHGFGQPSHLPRWPAQSGRIGTISWRSVSLRRTVCVRWRCLSYTGAVEFTRSAALCSCNLVLAGVRGYGSCGR